MSSARSAESKLYYTRAGAGEELVMLHGATLDHRVLGPLAAELGRDHRVTRPDLPGHGRSPAPANGYLIAGLARSVLSLMDELDIGPAWIVGYSLGGLLALELAHRSPERIRGIVLIASGLRLVPGRPIERSSAGRTSAEIEAGAGYESRYRELVTVAQALFPMAARDELWDELRRFDFRQRAPELRVPSLVISGELDHFFAPEVHGEALRLLPHAAGTILPDTTHGVVFEESRRCAELVRRFVAGGAAQAWQTVSER